MTFVMAAVLRILMEFCSFLLFPTSLQAITYTSTFSENRKLFLEQYTAQAPVFLDYLIFARNLGSQPMSLL